jgi:hypothetical protein
MPTMHSRSQLWLWRSRSSGLSCVWRGCGLESGGGGGCLLVSLLDLSKDARMQGRLSRWEGAVYEGVWTKGRTHGLWQLRVGLPDLVPIVKLAVNHYCLTTSICESVWWTVEQAEFGNEPKVVMCRKREMNSPSLLIYLISLVYQVHLHIPYKAGSI